MRNITTASVDDTVSGGSSNGSGRARTQWAALTPITIVLANEARVMLFEQICGLATQECIGVTTSSTNHQSQQMIKGANIIANANASNGKKSIFSRFKSSLAKEKQSEDIRYLNAPIAPDSTPKAY